MTENLDSTFTAIVITLMKLLPHNFAIASSVLLLLINLPSLAAQTPPPPPLLAVMIENQSGTRLPQAQVLIKRVLAPDGNLPTWKRANSSGIVTLSSSDIMSTTSANARLVHGRYEILAKAPGHATASRLLDLPSPVSNITIPLAVGRRVEVELKALAPLPDTTQLATFTTDTDFMAWQSIEPDPATLKPPPSPFSYHAIESLGKGRFAFHISMDTADTTSQTIAFLVNAPGLIRGFETDLYSHAQLTSSPIVIKLPSPPPVDVSVLPGYGSSQSTFPCGLQVLRWQTLHDSMRYILMRDVPYTPGTTLTETLTDLAPGRYSFMVAEGSPEFRLVTTNMPGTWTGAPYKDLAFPTSPVDSTTTISLVHNVGHGSDAEWRGNHSLTLNFRKLDRTVPEGRRWSLTTGGIAYFDAPRKEFYHGIIPASGTVEITGLPGVESPINAADYSKGRRRKLPPFFDVRVDGNFAGKQIILFESEWGENGQISRFLPLKDGSRHVSVDINLGLSKGDSAPNVSLLDVATSKTLRLSDFTGQVVFIYFWNTRCGSCQEIMARLDDIAQRRGEEWSGRAKILTASNDESIEPHLKRLKERGWTNAQHAFCHEGEHGYNSDASKAWGIDGASLGALISLDGKIQWIGHPWDDDIEDMITQQLRPQ